MIRNKLTFKVDDQEYAVKKPSATQQQDAQVVYSQTFAKFLKAGAMLKSQLEKYIVENNIWTEQHEEEFDKRVKQIAEFEDRLNKGGIALSEARRVAVSLRIARALLISFLSKKNELDEFTVESQAEDAKFDYLVSVCSVYNLNGEPVFSSLDDYIERKDEPVAIACANHLAMLLHNYDPDFEKKQVENKFLLEHKMCDDELRLVDKEGNLVDISGLRIDEDGNYLEEEVIETAPFINDLDNPTPENTEQPKKRGRKPKKE